MKATIALVTSICLIASPVIARENTYREPGRGYHTYEEPHSYHKKNNDTTERVAIGLAGLIIGAAIMNAAQTPPTPVVTLTREQQAYERGRQERLRIEQAQREQRAYECGYYGNC
jgi:hypothetical protein